MKSHPSLSNILWSSVTEAGFVAGLVSTVAQLLGLSGLPVTITFLALLIILSFTIFNMRLFFVSKLQQPLIYFINGHDATFDLLTGFVKGAKESIWVTRFSSGKAVGGHEYFDWLNRRMLGQGCKPVYDYRRIMTMNTADKAELVGQLIRLAGTNDNLYLSETQLTLFYELLIFDGEHAVVVFYEQDKSGIVNGALVANIPELVTKFRSIYETIWNNPQSQPIKDKALDEQEKGIIIQRYAQLAKTLSD